MNNQNTSIEKINSGDVGAINDIEWREIVNELVDQLSDGDVPEKVVRATELMLSGVPNYQVAKMLNVDKATVKSWMVKYPMVAGIVQQGRSLLSKWRMARLEQQFMTAVDKSREILEMNVLESDDAEQKVNAKLVAIQAQQSRFIIEQFTKQIADTSVQSDSERVTLSASAGAMAYIANELAKHREANDPVETTFRVLDPATENNQPVLDEQGNPIYGEMGVLDRNADGTLCHICGKRYQKLVLHLSTVHTTPDDVYELTFMLEEGTVKKNDNT